MKFQVKDFLTKFTDLLIASDFIIDFIMKE